MSTRNPHLATPLCGVTHPQALCAGRGWRSPHHGKEPLPLYRYNRPHFLRRRDSAWERRRDKICAIKQGMRQLSAPHRPGAAGMRELAPRSGERRDTAERCHEGLRHLLPRQPLRPAGQEPSIGLGQVALPRHPCHRLHPHPTYRTGHPARGIHQKHRDAPLEPLRRASRPSASRPKSRHIHPQILLKSQYIMSRHRWEEVRIIPILVA